MNDDGFSQQAAKLLKAFVKVSSEKGYKESETHGSFLAHGVGVLATGISPSALLRWVLTTKLSS